MFVHLVFPKCLGGTSIGEPVFVHVREKLGLRGRGEDRGYVVVSRRFMTIGWIGAIAEIGPVVFGKL